MIRKSATLAVAAMLALSLCACGGGSAQPATDEQPAEGVATEQAETTEETDAVELEPEDEATPEEYDPMVDNIDLTLEGGSIRYVSFEQANEGLVDADGALVFVFEFTNEQSKPAQCQNFFRIQFFQNGVELKGDLSYSSAGGEQYDLIGAFFSEAMKGGTITFGRIVVPQDDSPITIMVEPNGAPVEDNYQMMEVALDGSSAGSDEAASSESAAAIDDIDAALQGTWSLGGEDSFTFDNGELTFHASGRTISGTYEIDTEESRIIGHLQASDGNVKASISYTFEDGELRLFNKNGDEFTRE